MGSEEVSGLSRKNKTKFLRHLLSDIEALEHMIENDLMESGVTRIGAEQELCLVDSNLRPAMTGTDILSAANEPHLTTELALWNLELNLDPVDAGAGCLAAMESQLNSLLQLTAKKSAEVGSKIVLTGILPTIRKSELSSRFMTPSPRFEALDRVLRDIRGEDFSLYIEGVDEINLRHRSILFEACNTSFQIHLQVDPDDFADKYNWAQVIAGPILAACTNSPLLLGKDLWSETRIALFRRSIETRRSSNYINNKQPRVAFGNQWLKDSAAEIFKNDVATYKLIIAAEMPDETSMDLLARNEIPKLKAMNLHNGTLYKWNRACYGVGGGKAHLRIENRYVPAGPTPHDEMANVALWIGVMESMPEECRGQWEKHFLFEDVRSNFLKAARNGLSNEMRWFGEWLDVGDLIVDKLLPMAERGLAKIGVTADESARYLDTIRERVVRKRTGADWMIESFRTLRQKNSIDESVLLITNYMAERGLSETPGHEWELPKQSTLVDISSRYDRVDSIMVTDLVTVCEDDAIEFAEKLMEWNGFHNLPVENDDGKLVGIITLKDITGRDSECNKEMLVSDCMVSDIISVTPETSMEIAEQLMLANNFGSVPVVDDGCAIGIVTVFDIHRLQKKQ